MQRDLAVLTREPDLSAMALAVDHLRFYVNEGEVFGLLGPNGSWARQPQFAC